MSSHWIVTADGMPHYLSGYDMAQNKYSIEVIAHAGAQRVNGLLQWLGRGHACPVAQQHLLGHVHQLGVERSLGLCQQMMDGTGRVSVQALRDGGTRLARDESH